jgi:putative ABC transport system permease protein
MLDLRFLARHKVLTAIAVLTLGLAIGASTAALSVLQAFLFSSLGVPDVDRVVVVQPERELPGRGSVKFNDAYPNYQLLRSVQRSFADVAAVVQLSVSWDDHGEARQLSATRATATFFPTLRVRPLIGRTFTQEEEGPSPAPVMLVSHALWVSSLGADPAVVGRVLIVNGAPHVVIGVLPPRFDQPTPTDVWLPFDIPAAQRAAITGGRQLTIFARLADGRTFEAANREMAAFTARALEASGDNKDYRYGITTLRDNLLNRADESALFVLASAAGLLLLAVLNLSSLLLAWGFERRQEFAVRVALGAAKRHVTRLLLQQSFAITAAGAIVGAALSVVLLALLRQFDLGPTVTSLVGMARVSTGVLAVTIAFILIAGAAAGALPAWLTGEGAIGDTLRSASRGATLSRRAVAWQRAMVFCQAGLSLVILVTSALIAVSFWRLSNVPSGFSTRSRVVARVVLPDATYGTHAARAAFGRALAENLALETGLAAGGFTTALPVGDGVWGSRFTVERRDGTRSDELELFHLRRVSPSYLATMGIPLLRGRAFSARDDSTAIPVAIVSRALAERAWPGEDPLGRHLVRAGIAGAKPVTLTVVGVAGNTMDAGYSAPSGEVVYLPYSQASAPRLSIVVDGRGATATAVAGIRRALRRTDPVVAAGNVATLDALVLQANALPRLRTLVVLVFAVVSLGVVLLGSYGIMSQLVSAREREFAVRLVFGARPRQLGRAVLLQGARITLPGIVVGLAVAWLLSGALQAFVFGVQPTSVPVLVASGAMLFAFSVVATLPCAIRAMRVDVRRGIGTL